MSVMKGGNTPNLEVIPPAPKTVADHYAHAVSTAGRGRGRPRRYENKEELIDAIQHYLDDIVNPDGSYNRPPTWTGLGLHLGFASKKWDDNYKDTEEFGEIISQTRLMIDTWRQEQAMVPGKGVNAGGVMFLINQQNAREAELQEREAMKDITPDDEDTRPKEAGVLIDDVWSKKDG
jgi:hypothetical protein